MRDVAFNERVVRAQPDLIITIIENHDFVLGVDEQARIRCPQKESQFQHATTEMFVEKLGRVDLATDAFAEHRCFC